MKRLPIIHLPANLDIGCGRNKIDNHIGIDKEDYGQEIVWDIRDGIPLPNDSVVSVYSSHFFEHLTVEELSDVFSEIIRVCVDGAKIKIIVPHSDTKEAYYLCHYSLWNEKTIQGICADSFNLKLISTSRRGIHLTMDMEVVKGENNKAYHYDVETKVENFLGVVQFNQFKNIRNPEKTFNKAIDILNKHKAKWFVAFGTALGLYRDKDLIPEDSDFDLGIIVDNGTPQAFFDELLEEFKKEFKYLRSVQRDGRQHQSAFIDEDNIVVDLCFFYPLDKFIISHADNCLWKDRIEFFDELLFIDTKYGKLPFPNNPEGYLQDRYGDWRTKRDEKSIKNI